MGELGETVMTLGEFNALPEYACTMPTGPKAGFRWRVPRPWGDKMPDWYMGESIRLPEDDPEYETHNGVRWTVICIAAQVRRR